MDATPVNLPALTTQRHRDLCDWLARHFDDEDPPRAATWYLAEVLGWSCEVSKQEAAHRTTAPPTREGATEGSAQRASAQSATSEGPQDSGETLVASERVRLSFIVSADFEDEAPLSVEAIRYYADKVRDALDYSDCGQADNFDVEAMSQERRTA